MYFSSYSKTIKDNDKNIIQLIIEKIMKLLINQQTSQSNDIDLSKSQPRAFKARQKSKNNSNYQFHNWQSSIPKSTNKNQQVCKYYYSEQYICEKY